MNFTFHPDARIEFIDSIAFYERSREGLGLRFSREVYATIDRVMLGPTAWPLLTENTRRCLARRFPFGIGYEIREEDILIIAVTHLNREPFYWRDRAR
jgi:hypothetical protein